MVLFPMIKKKCKQKITGTSCLRVRGGLPFIFSAVSFLENSAVKIAEKLQGLHWLNSHRDRDNHRKGGIYECYRCVAIADSSLNE